MSPTVLLFENMKLFTILFAICMSQVLNAQQQAQPSGTPTTTTTSTSSVRTVNFVDTTSNHKFDATELARRGEIMWKDESFRTKIFKREGPIMTYLCHGTNSAVNQVAVDSPCVKNIDQKDLVAQHLCHLYDANHRVTSSHIEWRSQINSIQTPDFISFLETEPHPAECEVFLVSEALHAKTQGPKKEIKFYQPNQRNRDEL